MFFDDERIILKESVKIKVNDNVSLTCKLDISKQGYIPDLYVRFSDQDVRFMHLDEMELYDDSTFVGRVMKELRKLGFQGKAFGRAELGMQGDAYIVLEPSNDFCHWVEENYGWVDLDKAEA